MALMLPIYKQWNKLFFNYDIMSCKKRNFMGCRHLKYKKPFEFKTRLPKALKEGDKVYIYEPKRNKGCGQVIGEFTAGKIFKCDYPMGAFPFISYFCEHVVQNSDYARKFDKAFNTEMRGYKQGYIMKYALDEESVDHIAKYGVPPDLVDYLYDKERYSKIEESQMIWEWCDDWLRKIGFYNEFGESFYEYAITVVDPVLYDTPKPITDFHKEDGSVVEKAPQSFMYVQELQKG